MATISDTPVLQTPATQRVEARRLDPLASGIAPTTLEQDLAIAKALARLMDSQFEFGGVKFGLDAIIGLVPVAGDAIAFAIGMYPVFLARKHRLGRWVVARMMMNLGLDFLVGVVPIAGDALDVAFKANLKNYDLFEKAAAKHSAKFS